MIHTFTALAGKIENPLYGVDPKLDAFGVEFKGKIQLILAGVWALALVGAAMAVILAAGKWAWASRVTHSSEGVMEGAGQFKNAVTGFGAAAGASLVIGAILFVVQG